MKQNINIHVQPEETIRRLQSKTEAKIDEMQILFKLEKAAIQKSYEFNTDKLIEEHKEQMMTVRVQHENEIKQIKSSVKNLTSLHQKNLDAVNKCLDTEKADKAVILTYLADLKAEHAKLQEKFDQECYRRRRDAEEFQQKRSFDQSFLNHNNLVDFTDIEQLEIQRDAIELKNHISELEKTLLIEKTKTLADSILITRLKEDYNELMNASSSQSLRDKKIMNELRGSNQDLVNQVNILKKQVEKKNSSEASAKDKENSTVKAYNSEMEAKLRILQDENVSLKKQILALKNEIDSIFALNKKISTFESKLREGKLFYEDFNNRINKGVNELNEKRINHFNNMKQELTQEMSSKRKMSEISNTNEPPKRVTNVIHVTSSSSKKNINNSNLSYNSK